MSQAHRKILVVEDEPVILHTLELILKQNGYDVRVAGDAEEAFAIVPTFQPDVLLCDINLPSMDGIQIAIRIRREIPTCRIVLLSGEISSAELLDDAKKKGFHFEVLAKPTDPQHLLRVLAGVDPRTFRDPSGIHRVK